ncbi:MAG: radical SAM protein [Phycisphaeraceae bacterium]|nr:radical SAM protein [Phycisphaeraceae bacterium]
MELPRRMRGDELLRSGELLALRQRLRKVAPRHNLSAVIACAFDHRTRMLPFIYADTRMTPAGVRAIGSALVDSGFDKVRIVLQQWNPRFQPSRMKLDGRVPDLFLISSMGMHGQKAMAMIRDAWRIDKSVRPLIITGGPLAVYEPHRFFSADPSNAASADVVVTGEEFVLLSLLEAILDLRADGESVRSAFCRARQQGALDGIPGLVYPVVDQADRPIELIDSGVQRLLGDLDELPSPVIGYSLLEPPSRLATLGPKALAADQIRRLSPISSIVLTYGCKFACKYCPIPAYNQRQHRLKSGARIAEELDQLQRTYGLRYFFGADDNFFNDHERTMDIVTTLTRAEPGGQPLRQRVRWHTEATVHDTLKLREQLPLIRESGCRGLWLGVEDMTATLIKKGQDANKTIEAFKLLCDAGIGPHPMMMHHDSQPLYSRKDNYGIINQVNQLRKAGAISVQVLMLVPSPGSALYDSTYESGQAFESVAGRTVAPWMHDGNYVIASYAHRPWIKQVNIWLAYLSFYNPLNLLRALRRRKTKLGYRPAGMQIVGMLGLTQNIRRTFTWTLRLATGRFKRATQPPASPLPMRAPDGGWAEHAPHSGQCTHTVTTTSPATGLIPLTIAKA